MAGDHVSQWNRLTVLDPAANTDGAAALTRHAARYGDDVPWRTGWVCLCRSAELDTAGSQSGYAFLGEGVLVVRDHEGRINSYVNACRHRGHELVPCGRTVRRSTIWCSYHAWVYRLDGTLRTSPGFGDLAERDAEGMGLLPMHSYEWNGWLFVNLAGDAEPFPKIVAATRLPVPPNPTDLRHEYQRTQVVPVDWTSVIVDFLDHHRWAVRGDGPPPRTFPELGDDPHGMHYYGLLANLLIVGFSDHLATYRLEPVGPGRTRITYERLTAVRPAA